MRPGFIVAAVVVSLCAVVFRGYIREGAALAVHTYMGKKTVEDRLIEYGDGARARLAPDVAAAGVEYPPKAVTLIAIKDKKVMELWAADKSGAYRFVRAYTVLAASGRLGPKLMEGDSQVPEGFYDVTLLNANSLFHLSLRLNYPNDFDKEMGVLDKRENLGTDVMIHGGAASIGCLAMGDEVAEELFTLAADIGMANVKVIISPVDFRVTDVSGDVMKELPSWSAKLYGNIRASMKGFKRA